MKLKPIKNKPKQNDLKNLAQGLRGLQILFKEILQQMPPARANELIAAYNRGETIVLFIGQSPHGRDYKTAFDSVATQDQGWRGMLEAVGSVQ